MTEDDWPEVHQFLSALHGDVVAVALKHGVGIDARLVSMALLKASADIAERAGVPADVYSALVRDMTETSARTWGHRIQ